MAVIKQNISYGENKPERAFYGQEPLMAMYYKPDAETDPQLVYFYSEGTPGLRYDKNEGGKLMAYGFTGDPNSPKLMDFSKYGGEVDIPALTYEFGAEPQNTIYKVTEVGQYAFRGNSTIKTAKVKANVVVVGDNAFNSCSALTQITFGDKIEEIRNGAVNNCANLGVITLGQGVKTIGGWAFAFNPKLTKITIPASVSTVGRNTFEDCFALKELDFEEGSKLTEIPFGMCYGNTDYMNLDSVKIPKSVTAIGEHAFYHCNVAKVVVDDISSFCKIDFKNSYANPLNNINGVKLFKGTTEITKLSSADIASEGDIIFPELFYYTDIHTLEINTAGIVKVERTNGSDNSWDGGWMIKHLTITQCDVGSYFEEGAFDSTFESVLISIQNSTWTAYEGNTAVDAITTKTGVADCTNFFMEYYSRKIMRTS